MKILKYLIFLSILSGLFLVIYRQSDKKSFCRWWISFKTATLIAAILAGLILNDVEATKLDLTNNLPSIETVRSNQELNSLEENDQQVILARAESNPVAPTTGPTNFPTFSSGIRLNYPVRGVNQYRTPPQVTGQGFNAAANPAGRNKPGGGGAAEFDDKYPILKEQLQKSKTFDFDYRSNYPKKKSKDQCPIDQPKVNKSFKSNSSLKKVTKRALRNQDVKREYERIRERISEGVDPINIARDSTDLGDGLTYVRGRHSCYLLKNDNNGVKNVVGIAYRGSRNDMKTLAKEMNKSYNVNIEPGGY